MYINVLIPNPLEPQVTHKVHARSTATTVSFITCCVTISLWVVHFHTPQISFLPFYGPFRTNHMEGMAPLALLVVKWTWDHSTNLPSGPSKSTTYDKIKSNQHLILKIIL